MITCLPSIAPRQFGKCQVFSKSLAGGPNRRGVLIGGGWNVPKDEISGW